MLVGLEEAEGSVLCLYDLGLSRVVKAVVIPGRVSWHLAFRFDFLIKLCYLATVVNSKYVKQAYPINLLFLLSILPVF